MEKNHFFKRKKEEGTSVKKKILDENNELIVK
jgi:hypothetical protein